MTPLRNSMLFRKVYGCLGAGAIGDQLGRPVEGWHYLDIEKHKGRLVDPWETGERTAGGDRNFEIGTDDTALGQILCHAYLAKGGRITVEDYAKQWLAEFQPTRFFFCMRNTYELLKMGYSPRLTGALNIVTGSGLMAINPVGIYNACDPQAAYAEALEIASMFQRDLDILIPGVIAGAIAAAFQPGATADSVLDTAIDLAPSDRIITFDERRFDNLKDSLVRAVEIGRAAQDVFSAREGLYAEMLQYAPIDPQEVFALTFGIFAAARGDTEQAMLGGANIGRDADTIASLNGQLCGALNGIDSVPQRWVEGLERSPSAESFIRTAEGMTELVITRLHRMREQVGWLDQMVGPS
ncbi:MAG: ADP-ribosylglycohydrolase family protein [Candidatus Zipacnadales bacterium]